MQRSLHLILTLSFSLYVLSGPVLWATYFVFADRIAAAYCVNRDDPSCHGRCHVRKVSEEKKEGRAPASVVSPEKLLPFLLVGPDAELMTSAPLSFNGIDADHCTDGFPQDIDHPPLLFI